MDELGQPLTADREAEVGFSDLERQAVLDARQSSGWRG